eukprot:CAMPEP_0181232320 /NCGR_PEP_ID=MMETSP1096-20121128/35661_1 /TAXON_ID=156174 ORGANISM="Chrysochromulina ericina, Strain CCMP281" /NCGR_SAMPLE_ID=MMETSP1096 /ASSEMBLY_ACC=CAM_ASM_000453 /LENGTH=42 /DNA_ID= /DNA_START= /DNA_END= /DNA_ORIENTATION=
MDACRHLARDVMRHARLRRELECRERTSNTALGYRVYGVVTV